MNRDGGRHTFCHINRQLGKGRLQTETHIQLIAKEADCVSPNTAKLRENDLGYC